MNAYAAYRALTAEQKQLLRTKQVEGAHTPAEWLALLTPLGDYDQSADKLRKAGCTAGIISGVVLFASLFLLGIFAPLAVLLIVGALTVLVVAIIVYQITSKLDLATDLHKFVLPLLAVLREDAAPGQPVRLALDMRGSTVDAKQVRQTQPYAAGAYHKVVATFYEDPWLRGEAPLADGSRLSWRLVDRVRKLEKTKRNPRGKTKTKTRHKQKTHMVVQLALRGDRYAVADAGTAASADRLEVTPGEKRHTVKLHRVVQTDALATPEPQQLLELIGAAFSRATPVKKQ
ncbi:MAG TPA: hypothetical protein VF546_20370 [Pyrinomonadaceae bacterium]